MRKKVMSTTLKAAVFACAVGFISLGCKTEAKAEVFLDKDGNAVTTNYSGWSTVQGDTSGKKYWFDNGELARSKEVYDGESNAWYWFEEDGTMATGKDVFVPTNAERTEGKWVRYDENGGMIKGESCIADGWYRFDEITGVMIKGWYTNDEGNLYYYDEITGLMSHGARDINGVPCAFDDNTGVAVNCQWYTINGDEYWYENGVRQGLEGRGKEIYDPTSDAWYWLDAIDGGRKAKGKDVYQESSGGKWVRYDENGGMIKGWDYYNGNVYYFDLITGAMTKGEYCDSDGYWYLFDDNTGVMCTGHVYRNGNWYYYDIADGYMIKGNIKLADGYTYVYDETTGVLTDKYVGDINYNDNLIINFEDEFDVHCTYSGNELYSKAMMLMWESETDYYTDGTYNVMIDCTILIGYMSDYPNASIKYELFDENGNSIYSSRLLVLGVVSGQLYEDTIYFFSLAPGKYTLKFSDFYY